MSLFGRNPTTPWAADSAEEERRRANEQAARGPARTAEAGRGRRFVVRWPSRTNKLLNRIRRALCR